MSFTSSKPDLDTTITPTVALSLILTGKGGASLPADASHVPSTPEEFAECNRLLRAHPAWQNRIMEIGFEIPSWMPVTDEWDILKTWLDECSDPDGYITRASYNQARDSYNRLFRRLDYLRVRVIWKNYRRQV